MNSFINVKRLLTQSDITKFERDYGISMPYKIKEHYIKYNGGYPERNVFCIKGDDTKYIIDYFYSIGCSEGNMLEKVLPLLRDSNVFPEWLVPLADEGGGIYLLTV